jgi:hypothetical protein
VGRGVWGVVDFNNESTVATPPGEVVKIVVLERREQVIEALESYYVSVAGSRETHHKVATLRARVMAFWFQVQAMARRRLKDNKYDEVERSIGEARSFEELVGAFEWLNEFVDDMGLTFIDGRARYDRSRVEDANTKKGL